MPQENDHVCPWWLAYTFDNPLRKLIHKPERMFAGHVRPGMTVADIGCGMGYFSLGLARMVGPAGKVLSVDMQPEMLMKTAARGQKAGLADVIETRLCSSTSLELVEPLDFVLAFWMVHETPDQAHFLRQLKTLLKPAGRLLVAEPKMHVSAKQFEATLGVAQTIGMQLVQRPGIAFSFAALLKHQ